MCSRAPQDAPRCRGSRNIRGIGWSHQPRSGRDAPTPGHSRTPLPTRLDRKLASRELDTPVAARYGCRVWFVFADDSEEKHPRRLGLGHLVGVGAVLFPEGSLIAYTEGIRQLRNELGVPPGIELKWSPPHGSWLKSAEGNAIRTPLRKRMLMLAKDLDARSLTVVWDRGQVEWAVPDTRREVLKYLYDKVSLCLTTLEAHGVVIADEPGGGSAEQRAWLAETLPLTDEGTYYTKPERILLPITTAPSNHIPHLQLADLIAGATTAAIAGNR